MVHLYFEINSISKLELELNLEFSSTTGSNEEIITDVKTCYFVN